MNRNFRSTRSLLLAVASALAGLCSSVSQAADYQGEEVAWEFKSGLDRDGFRTAFKELSEGGYRIADMETYRSGRNTAVSTVWLKLKNDESWRVEMSQPITEFAEAHEKNLEDGYDLVEFEVFRNGATLHFSGVWSKQPKPLETEFYFGMESLDFSNRYGEMADRGYRLIDFEAYEANGKYRHAGLWIKNEDDEVRFYRGIDKNRFGELAALLDQSGFRILDVEGYVYEGKFVFAAEWVRRKDWQESVYAFDLLADEFYNKNATYTNDGYRLTEFETYEDNGVVYYAGSWLKGKSTDAKKAENETPAGKKKKLSLEQFRSSED